MKLKRFAEQLIEISQVKEEGLQKLSVSEQRSQKTLLHALRNGIFHQACIERYVDVVEGVSEFMRKTFKNTFHNFGCTFAFIIKVFRRLSSKLENDEGVSFVGVFVEWAKLYRDLGIIISQVGVVGVKLKKMALKVLLN